MFSEQAAGQEEVNDRTLAIAHAWYQAIAGTIDDPHSSAEIRDRLAQLADNSFQFLHAETVSAEQAQAIGAALADLHTVQGESLGASIELLSRELPAGLAADQLLDLQPRLSALLGEIAHGFLQRALAAGEAEQALKRSTETRLLEKERIARREAETLREVAASMNASLEQEELLSLILTQLKHVLHFDSATILLYQEASLAVIAHQGILVQAAESYKQVEQLPPNLIRLSLEKEPQIISDTRDHAEWVVYPGGEFIRCWLGVPLMVKGELIGLLMLDSSEPNFYKEQDAALALAFANHAAVAIENARLYRESQQYAELLEKRVEERTRELGALYEITAVSSQHLELQDALDRVISSISATLDCRTVTIQILDETGATLRLAGQKGLSPQMLDYLQVLPAANVFMEKIILGNEPFILKEAQTDPRLSDVPIQIPTTFSVGTPIRAKGTVLGVLGIAVVRPEPPTREDIALLTSIADQIGVTIDNARLRRQSEELAVLQERERLARDLHDSATQSLFSLTLFAAAAREHLSSGKVDLVQEQLVELEKTAVQTHKEMRLLLYELRPTVLEEEGLEEALQRRIQMVEVRSGISGHIAVELSAKLPAAIEQVLYQVANEGLNNTLKHSGADSVIIHIAADDAEVRMKISDNGRGFTVDDPEFHAGMGMENMRQRVAVLGGTFDCKSQPTAGTTIMAQIPFKQEASPGDS